MTATLKRFEARISEEDCLDEVMRLRPGDEACPACNRRAGFTRLAKHRTYACKGCSFQVYPCQGTPLAKSRSPLTHWFLAVDLMSRQPRGGERAARRALGGNTRANKQILASIRTMKAEGAASDGGIDWFAAIANFVQARERAHAKLGPSGVGATDAPETAWQTLRAALRLPEFDVGPLTGIAAIVLLSLMGAGIGWLTVPSPPEEDPELVQATAILTLASDKPVILVSAEVAEQLYDVTDVDATPGSPLAPSIRISAPANAQRPGSSVADAQPMSRPAIKLAPAIGRELLRGDRSAATVQAQARPELAAYTSLARELDATGARNPDELLTFGPMRIRRHLVEKIVRAARVTDMDPVLLMAIADKESSFQTEVQAQTSSAAGLFQFIERTWLGVMREFGPKYGLEKEAQSIAGGEIGGAERTRLLDMRRDAYLSAVLAGEMLKRDGDRIARRVGRALTGGEVYLVHFLGPDGAERLLDQVKRNPDAVAADLLPRPAAANRPIFYGSAGDGTTKGLSVSEVQAKFETMISLRLDRYRAVKPAASTATAAR